MSGRAPVTIAEREQIWRDKLAGKTLTQIATDLDRSYEVVRKWWRVARDHGRCALLERKRGRPANGLLSSFAPSLVAQVLALKRANPRWGPDRVLVALRLDPDCAHLLLPSRSRLAALFAAECPECVGNRAPKRRASKPPPKVSAAHECWQLDMQEGIRLASGGFATICTIRDVVGAAILVANAFEVSSGKRYRKLRWQEIQQVIRIAASRWGTLPDSLQTDNEVGLAGHASDGFPSSLTLWLAGLGVVHQFSRPGRPTDQAQIERTHRTLDNFAALLDQPLERERLQERLELECEQYNRWFPSRASDCDGRPPLLAHPELERPRRAYQPERERAVFLIEEVYACLSRVKLSRKVTTAGQLQVRGCRLGVGRAYAGQLVTVGCDPVTHEWVIWNADQQEISRQLIKGLDVTSLTGLPEDEPCERAPLQLTLPCLAA